MNEYLKITVDFFCGAVSSLPRIAALAFGSLWAYLEPTFPFAMICVFAVILDCITAWRLNRRIRLKFPKSGADGKLKSSHMTKMIADLLVLWMCIILANFVDLKLLPHLGDLHLGQYVAAMFVFCTAVSILENESSCKGATWARLLQKVLANKMSRHIDMDKDEIDKTLASEL